MDDAAVLQVVAAASAGIVAIISVLFYNLRRSRCNKCSSPCCSIDREIMTADEMCDDVLSLSM